MNRKVKISVKGFTIVEFLIASTIFAAILVIVMSVIISFTHHYYRAVNSASTQNAARTIMNQVSNAIEFSPSNVSSSSNGSVFTYCIGYTQFDYQLNVQQGGTAAIPDAIWQTSSSPNSPCQSLNTGPASTSSLLLSKGMRLLYFNINSPNNNGIYNIDVDVAYGGNNVLCNINIAPNCPATGNNTAASNTGGGSSLTSSTTACVQTSGSQFCDLSALHTTVGMRLPVSN